MKTTKMKIEQITKQELELDVQFPFYRKNDFYKTKWISETENVTVFSYGSIAISSFNKLIAKDWFEIEISKLEFEEELQKVIEKIMQFCNPNPELNVSEG